MSQYFFKAKLAEKGPLLKEFNPPFLNPNLADFAESQEAV